MSSASSVKKDSISEGVANKNLLNGHSSFNSPHIKELLQSLSSFLTSCYMQESILKENYDVDHFSSMGQENYDVNPSSSMKPLQEIVSKCFSIISFYESKLTDSHTKEWENTPGSSELKSPMALNCVQSSYAAIICKCFYLLRKGESLGDTEVNSTEAGLRDAIVSFPFKTETDEGDKFKELHSSPQMGKSIPAPIREIVSAKNKAAKTNYNTTELVGNHKENFDIVSAVANFGTLQQALLNALEVGNEQDLCASMFAKSFTDLLHTPKGKKVDSTLDVDLPANFRQKLLKAKVPVTCSVTPSIAKYPVDTSIMFHESSLQALKRHRKKQLNFADLANNQNYGNQISKLKLEISCEDIEVNNIQDSNGPGEEPRSPILVSAKRRKTCLLHSTKSDTNIRKMQVFTQFNAIPEMNFHSFNEQVDVSPSISNTPISPCGNKTLKGKEFHDKKLTNLCNRLLANKMERNTELTHIPPASSVQKNELFHSDINICPTFNNLVLDNISENYDRKSKEVLNPSVSFVEGMVNSCNMLPKVVGNTEGERKIMGKRTFFMDIPGKLGGKASKQLKEGFPKWLSPLENRNMYNPKSLESPTAFVPLPSSGAPRKARRKYTQLFSPLCKRSLTQVFQGLKTEDIFETPPGSPFRKP